MSGLRERLSRPRRRQALLALALLLAPACSESADSRLPCALGTCPDAAANDDAGARDGASPADLVSLADLASPADLDAARPTDAPSAPELVDVQRAAQLIADGMYTLLDVREPSEFASGHIAGALNLPWTSGVLQQRWAELAAGKGVIVYCRSGSRSAPAAAFLAGHGFSPVFNVDGGIVAWQAAGLPVTQN